MRCRPTAASGAPSALTYCSVTFPRAASWPRFENDRISWLLPLDAGIADRWWPSRTGGPDASYVSTTCGRVLTRAGNDRRQVEPVRGTIARVVLFESGRTPLEEPDSAGAVPAGGMREADTDLGQTLPQVAFFARTSLPAGLQDLMRSKGPALSYQTPGQVQGLRRRQWLLRNRLDAGRPVGQRPAKSITRPLLTWATGSVAVPIAGHCWLQPECPRTIPNVIRPMVGVGSPNIRNCRISRGVTQERLAARCSATGSVTGRVRS